MSKSSHLQRYSTPSELGNRFYCARPALRDGYSYLILSGLSKHAFIYFMFLMVFIDDFCPIFVRNGTQIKYHFHTEFTEDTEYHK